MMGWHHRCDGQEFEQALGGGEGQGNLGCCSPWSHKELDTTERLKSNNTRRGVGMPKSLFLHVPTLREQGAAFRSCRSGDRPPLPSWAPGVGTSCCHHEGHTTGCPCLPGRAHGSHGCTSLVGANGQRIVRKETASIQTKNNPRAKKI